MVLTCSLQVLHEVWMEGGWEPVWGGGWFLHVPFLTLVCPSDSGKGELVLCLEKAASVGRCMTYSAPGKSVSQSVEGARGLGLWENNNLIFSKGREWGGSHQTFSVHSVDFQRCSIGRGTWMAARLPPGTVFCHTLIKSGQGHGITGPVIFPRDLPEVCPACVQ